MRTISHGFGVSVCLPILCPSAAEAVGDHICELLNHMSRRRTCCTNDIHHGVPAPALSPADLCISRISLAFFASFIPSYFFAAACIALDEAFSTHLPSKGVDLPSVYFGSPFPLSLFARYSLQKSPALPGTKAPNGANISAKNRKNGES